MPSSTWWNRARPLRPTAAATTVPVDYKKGAPREGEDANEIWDADRMQLGLQMLILRENGYDCTEGVIYYQATRQRVRLPWTADLAAWIEQTAAQARGCAASADHPAATVALAQMRALFAGRGLSAGRDGLADGCTRMRTLPRVGHCQRMPTTVPPRPRRRGRTPAADGGAGRPACPVPQHARLLGGLEE